MRRFFSATGAAALLLLAVLVPAAAAASSETFGWTDAWQVQHDCSIVEDIELEASGRAYFDNDGEWVRDVIRFRYSVTYENVDTGVVLVTRMTQIAEVSPGTGVLRGQGTFIRGGVVGGVAFPDVGVLVFDTDDESTLFASAHVVPLDDPDGGDAINAALCAAMG